MTRTHMASRVVGADPHQVFAALVDEKALVTWLPPADMIGRFEHFDMRPGGSYRMALTYRDHDRPEGKSSPGTDVVDVRIVEIVPGQRIVQAITFDSDESSYSGTMTMTWLLSRADGGTRIDLTARDVPAGISAEDHAIGMNSSLANLETFLRRGADPGR